ncbi:hypothetical protein MKS88_000831 [Plasmodium brasilianum]|uniref:Uncharacterized protein n=1 Tax=Plasmodium brasilianum TaxID=5824 RepID=A0ACB9YFX3_PLABR|nr:hypothetical protein MKS88_000831 [Plasmodium brasilianum]
MEGASEDHNYGDNLNYDTLDFWLSKKNDDPLDLLLESTKRKFELPPYDGGNDNIIEKKYFVMRRWETYFSNLKFKWADEIIPYKYLVLIKSYKSKLYTYSNEYENGTLIKFIGSLEYKE